MWTTLGAINDIARGGSPRPIKDFLTDDEDGVNWIKISDTTRDGKYIDSVKERIRKDGVKKSRMVYKGDFLLTNSMSFGRPYILNVDGCIHDGWLVISPIGNAYTADFLYYLLSSSFALDQFTEVASGGVVTNLNSAKVSDTLFPLPPIGEQQRIAVEIEHWFALIDQLEQGKENLQTAIKQAKSKILELAISGKLVPQNPADEPASELLKRINPKAEIACDNEHYPQLPKGWYTCRLEEVTEILDSKRQPVSSVERSKRIANKSREELYPYYGATGLVGMIDDYLIEGDYLLLGEDGAPFLDKDAIKAYPISGKCWVNNHAHILAPLCAPAFLLHYLNHLDYSEYAKGSTRLKLTQADMRSIRISLPPLAEQKRIVDKIEQLFSLLEEIEESL